MAFLIVAWLVVTIIYIVVRATKSLHLGKATAYGVWVLIMEVSPLTLPSPLPLPCPLPSPLPSSLPSPLPSSLAETPSFLLPSLPTVECLPPAHVNLRNGDAL